MALAMDILLWRAVRYSRRSCFIDAYDDNYNNAIGSKYPYLPPSSIHVPVSALNNGAAQKEQCRDGKETTELGAYKKTCVNNSPKNVWGYNTGAFASTGRTEAAMHGTFIS